MIKFIIPLLMMILLLMCLNQRENWRYQNWDFDDFPRMCKCKLEETNEALAFANTPHFGGTPNNSQVWM
jgi:hypothetical protein